MRKDQKNTLTSFVKSRQLKFINGKYFCEDEDGEFAVIDIDRALTKDYINTFGVAPDKEEIAYLKSAIKALSYIDDTDKREWPKLPIVLEVENIGKFGADFWKIYEETKLPFELTAKQYMILNRILFHPEERYLWIVTGAARTGKSTFLNLVKQLFDNDYYALSITAFDKQFGLAPALSCRLAGGDDMGDDRVQETDKLKSIVSQQAISVEEKFQAPYTVHHPQTQLFFCCNEIPMFDFTSDGILRRLMIYGRETKIEDTNDNIDLLNYKYSNIQLLKIALISYEFPMDNWKEIFQEETCRYVIYRTSVGQYYINFKVNRFSHPEYKGYLEYCINQGIKYPYAKRNYDMLIGYFDKYRFDIDKLRKWSFYKTYCDSNNPLYLNKGFDEFRSEDIDMRLI